MWNFKGTLWNSTQNILPIHWKIRFLYNIEILRALRFKSSYAFFKRPPCQSKAAVTGENALFFKSSHAIHIIQLSYSTRIEFHSSKVYSHKSLFSRQRFCPSSVALEDDKQQCLGSSSILTGLNERFQEMQSGINHLQLIFQFQLNGCHARLIAWNKSSSLGTE